MHKHNMCVCVCVCAHKHVCMKVERESCHFRCFVLQSTLILKVVIVKEYKEVKINWKFEKYEILHL
jgi:hypothetical protein